MNSADHIRNTIIDKLLTISNTEYLSALSKLLESSHWSNDIVTLSDEQKLMLQMSDLDIKNGKTISQENLDKEDLEWLNSL